MTALMNWLSPTVMHSLGWALLHFLWQGTALAALAAAAMALCRRASARYLVGVGALVLMLLSPVATFRLFAAAFRCGRRRDVVAPRRARGASRNIRLSDVQRSHLRSMRSPGWLKLGFWAWPSSVYVPRADSFCWSVSVAGNRVS